MLSNEFLVRLKFNDKPAYRIAQKAGIHPSTLSKLVCGIEEVKAGDVRVEKVGRVLGLKPNQCFDGDFQKS